jgi:hypothetical protein
MDEIGYYGTLAQIVQATKRPARTVGLSRVKELAAQASVARWADGVTSRNRASARYYSDPRNTRGDWPEDH